ncbi:3-phosphoshikimate 1-carboxyvinyltransferase [Candidatus Sumerlaeota bacterium]|nr:3-phosphoshikimate 1-carboxyvinyltransferase [Candidatus Sumerlaeota bacterium]
MRATVHPCPRLEGRVEPPSSKNYTSRFLLVSALAEGVSRVLRPATSDDAEAMIRCLRQWGAGIREVEGGLEIRGFGRSPRSGQTLDPGNAGAVVRFLMGVAATARETRFTTSHLDSLGKRPHADLLRALEQLGCITESEGEEGRLPIVIRGGEGRLRGGRVEVSGEVSSQYLSALLFLAPLIGEDVEIVVTGDLKSKPAVRTTLEVLRGAGVEIASTDDLMSHRVAGGQSYRAGEFTVNGDWPGASALLAAAAVTEGSVEIPQLHRDQQGEQRAFDVLRSMGAQVTWEATTVKKSGISALRGVEFDGDQATDAVLALAATAALAEGTTRFFNVENLRHKECDRISDFLAALREVGVQGEERRDELIIHGHPEGYQGGVNVWGRGDHRVIMALSIIALRCREPLTITGVEHVAKSYPAFFDDLRGLGARIDENPE